MGVTILVGGIRKWGERKTQKMIWKRYAQRQIVCIETWKKLWKIV